MRSMMKMKDEEGKREEERQEGQERRSRKSKKKPNGKHPNRRRQRHPQKPAPNHTPPCPATCWPSIRTSMRVSHCARAARWLASGGRPFLLGGGCVGRQPDHLKHFELDVEQCPPARQGKGVRPCMRRSLGREHNLPVFHTLCRLFFIS